MLLMMLYRTSLACNPSHLNVYLQKKLYCIVLTALGLMRTVNFTNQLQHVPSTQFSMKCKYGKCCMVVLLYRLGDGVTLWLTDRSVFAAHITAWATYRRVLVVQRRHPVRPIHHQLSAPCAPHRPVHRSPAVHRQHQPLVQSSRLRPPASSTPQRNCVTALPCQHVRRCVLERGPWRVWGLG